MNVNKLLQVVKKRRRVLNSAFSIALSMALSLFLCTSLVSCAGGAGGGGSDGAEETALSVTFPQTMATYTATDLASYSVTIESSKYTATKSGPAGGTITFTNIPVGTYKVTAYGKKADGTIAAKNNPNETSVTIEEGKTKTTVIRLHLLEYFTVTFKSGYDNSVITTQQVISGEKATRPSNPASPETGLYFVNWYSDDDYTEIFNFNTAINADIDVYAKFDDAYTVTLNYNGGKDASNNTSSSDTYSYNDHVNVPETITKTGYTRLGWATTADAPIEDVIISIPDVTGDATYYAIWGLATYNITYDSTSMTYGILNAASPNSYTYGTAVTIPDAGGAGTTFAGWYTDAALTTEFTGITATTTGNITLYAKFTATVRIYKEKVSGTLTTLLDTQTVTCGKTATALATAPTKTGYEWDEWKYGTGAGSTFTFGSTSGTAITGDCDVWATWTPSYTIMYHNVNIGSGSTYKGTISATAISSYTYNATSSTDLPSPTVSDSNYEFGGWYETSDFSDTGVTAVPAGSTGNKNYYAKYKYKLNSITCSIEDFNAIDGFSQTSITWKVTGSFVSISDIVSAIASKGIDVDLDLTFTTGGISGPIGAGTFDSIKDHLVGISLPGGMMTIATNTFNGYDKLTSVWIPPTVNSIEVGAFEGCTSLATVDGLSGSSWHARDGAALNAEVSIDSTTISLLTQAGVYFDRLP